jgi:hypothetical protein
VAEVMVKWKEVTVYQKPQRTLSRIGSTVVPSTPSCQEIDFKGYQSISYFPRGGTQDNVQNQDYSSKEAWITEKFDRISEV